MQAIQLVLAASPFFLIYLPTVSLRFAGTAGGFLYVLADNLAKWGGIMAELSPRHTKAATLQKLTEPLGLGSVVVEPGCVHYSEELAWDDGWSTVYLASRGQN